MFDKIKGCICWW